MKRFETMVGSEWRAWRADEKTTISKKSGVVTVVMENAELTGEDGPRRVKMVFNLATIPVYAVVD